MDVTQEAIEIIKAEETLQLVAYQDGESISIGYGHSNTSGGEQFELGDTITEEKADELLLDDLEEIERIVNQRMKNYNVVLTQGQYDAMVVGTYNRPEKLKSKKIYTILASGDMDAIKKAWDNTISDNDRENYPGLVNRLEAELNLIDNVEEPTTPDTPEPQDPDRGIPAPSETFVPDSLPVTRRTPEVKQDYYTQVPLAAQNPSYARVKQMLEAQVNKQKKSAGHSPVIPGVAPQISFNDAVRTALKLLGR
jgi:GH24 family phage-related lysozyme (muramidase)